ncbi:MAG: nitroreductase family protein [Deltaproteobacteria bacterium]
MTADLVLRNAVAAAVMAPSSHNTQPWRFKISDGSLDLYADAKRQLLVIDRDCRQLVQSCGAALMNARVAIRASGHEAVVTVLLTDRDLPLHLARIQLGGAHLPTDLDHQLMKAIARRGTNRRSFLARPVAGTLTDALAMVAQREGVKLVRLDPDQKAALAPLIQEADSRQYANPEFRDELTGWLASPRSRRQDGIPFTEKEYGSPKPFGLARTMRSPMLGDLFATLEESLVRGAPAVVVLGTPADTPSAWLACGQALEAVLLRATMQGLAAAFLNQVLELPDLRAQVAKLVPRVGHPQMILRIGVPSEPIERVSPRREIDDVLDS